MAAYLARRLLYTVVAFFLLTLTVFSAVRLMPGNAVYASLAESGFAPSPEALKVSLHELGLDGSYPTQYLRWLGRAVRGDFGQSFTSHRSVNGMLGQALPVTLELGVFALAVCVVVGLPLGVVAGLKRNTPIDFLSRLVAILGVTVPSFVIALVVLLLGLRWFNWVPPTRFRSLADDPARNLEQFIIPALVLGYALSAGVTRMMRSTVLEVLNEDFVRTARAKGLVGRVVVSRHVLRNALIPVITVIGLQAAAVFGGAVIIESIFNLPGLGNLLLNAVTHRDYPVVQGAVLFIGAAVIAVNLVVDLAYGYIDPRIRFG